MIIEGHPVVSQNIDLFLHLLASLQQGFHFVDRGNPFVRQIFGNVGFKFGVFNVLGIRINRIDGRITFTVGPDLFQRKETTCGFFSSFGHRFLKVTACGRNRTDKGDGSRLSVIEDNIACTPVKG